jgi:hypothetical protein
MVPVVRKLARLENAHDKQLITFFCGKEIDIYFIKYNDKSQEKSDL